MAKKSTNGHSEFELQMLQVLVDIRGELRELSSRVDQTNSRLDQLIANMGTHWPELDRRVTALELRDR